MCVFVFVCIVILVFVYVLIFIFVQQWWAVVSSHGDPISTAVASRSPNHLATLAEPHKAPQLLPGTVQMYLYSYRYPYLYVLE